MALYRLSYHVSKVVLLSAWGEVDHFIKEYKLL